MAKVVLWQGAWLFSFGRLIPKKDEIVLGNNAGIRMLSVQRGAIGRQKTQTKVSGEGGDIWAEEAEVGNWPFF